MTSSNANLPRTIAGLPAAPAAGLLPGYRKQQPLGEYEFGKNVKFVGAAAAPQAVAAPEAAAPRGRAAAPAAAAPPPRTRGLPR